MAEDENAIDELSERIGQLSEEDRGRLLESLREDQLSAYLDARGEFMDALREEGLIGQYPEDSPWADYCEQHPNDPLCWRMVGREEQRENLRKYQRARGRFVDRLQERGLLSEGRMDPLTRPSDVMGIPEMFDRPDIGYTPDPREPWPPQWICWRYPWLCDLCRRYPWLCYGTSNPFPVPRPQPDPSPIDPYGLWNPAGGQHWQASTDPRGNMAMDGWRSAYDRTPMSGRTARLSAPIDDISLPPDDLGTALPDWCRSFPWLPECGCPPGLPGCPCPPWLPECRCPPWLPECPPYPCPPICAREPWHPFCRRCWEIAPPGAGVFPGV